MAYLTPADLANGAGMLKELAELYGVDDALMRATLDYDNRSAWSPEQIAAADAAVSSIETTLELVDAEMHTYLARRGYALPLSAAQFPVLTVWARHIARYHVQPQRDRTTEDSGRIERDYRQTLRTLEFVAAGKLDLGAGDPLAVQTPQSAEDGAVHFESAPRRFGRGAEGHI